MPNAAFLKAGLLEVTEEKVTSAQVYLMSEGGTALVYLTVPDADGQLLARARTALTGIEGIDAMIDPMVAPYDVAPMRTILPEAGGRFTDLAGVDRADGGSGLATNGLLHDQVLERMKD